jgi:sulfur carrier protein
MEIAGTRNIKIVLNGEPRSVPAGLNIEQLLIWLETDPSRVAVELNREIVRKPEWPTAAVEDGAQLEVVWFVGGGLI